MLLENEKEDPLDLTESTVISVYTKVTRVNCDRDISLIQVALKVFASVVLHRRAIQVEKTSVVSH